MKTTTIIYITFFILLLLFILFIIIHNTKNKIIIDEKFLKMNSCFIQPINKPFHKYNICIITLETRKLDIINIHNENIKKYCIKHGYTYLYTNNYDNPLELPVYWKKLQIIKDNLSKYDYVLWLDSDTIICHREVPLEFLILESPKSSIFIGKDYPCTKNEPYCAGVFMIKNDYHGNKFINDCINTYLSRNECKNQGQMTLAGKYAGRCYEQGIMNELLSEYSNALYYLEHKYVMNTIFPCYGTFILHYYERDKNLGYHVFKKFRDTYIEMIPLTKNLYHNKICILLTMYSSDKKRYNLYNENITKWLKTGFDIFSVDSSGIIMNITHPKYKQFVFKQDTSFQMLNSSMSEKNSIIKAFNYFNDFKDYDLIFKITGKYFLPDFKDMTEYIPHDFDIVIQNRDCTSNQNSEIYGIKPHKMHELLNLIRSDWTMEQALYHLSQNAKEKTIRLRPLVPYKKVKRGDGTILDFL